MYLKRVDVSENSISDVGIQTICPYIGLNKKTSLKVINFSNNQITYVGLMSLFVAIKNKKNVIKELNFVANNLTDEAA